MNRSETPSTALRAPSPPLGERDGMRGRFMEGAHKAGEGIGPFCRHILIAHSQLGLGPIAVCVAKFKRVAQWEIQGTKRNKSVALGSIRPCCVGGRLVMAG